MLELARVKPFRLSLLSGLYGSQHGPLIWMLFHVPAPGGKPSEPFASVQCHTDPSNPHEMVMWRRLASQTHWRLVLIGPGRNVVNSFEFENDYDLGEGLQTMTEACRSHRVLDFELAKQEFCRTQSTSELYAMI